MRKTKLKGLLLKLKLIHRKKRHVMATKRKLNQTNHYLVNLELFISTNLMGFIIV
tara:strand:- start:249 stop:413 length:165 start_codon:yes stop_codon:yes gene_type:complete